MTTAVVKHPYTIEIGIECLNTINAVFKLNSHVVICPVSLLPCPIAILEELNKWRFF
jgi:hypothetical protein